MESRLTKLFKALMVMLLCISMAASPVLQSIAFAETQVQTVSATFYVLNRDKPTYRSSVDPQFYTHTGYGTINAPAATIAYDTESVHEHIVTIPDPAGKVSLAANETVEWYKIIASGSRWYVYGEIITTAVAEPDPSTPAEPAAPVAARFYVLNRGNEKYRSNPDPQFYTYTGYGTVNAPDAPIADNPGAVQERIVTMSDPAGKVSMAANETVQWYKIISSGSQFHIYGEIITTAVVEPEQPAPEEPAVPIAARFYVLNRGNGKYRSNPDPQFYTYTGYGTVNAPDAPIADNPHAVQERIVTMPDPNGKVSLAANETVQWYKIISSGSQLHIYGEIITTAVVEPEQPVTEEPAVPITAMFYVLNRGNEKYRSSPDPQYYTSLGYYAAFQPSSTKLEDDYDSILACISNPPSTDKLALAPNETIRWFRVQKLSSNGQWWFFGEILTDGDVKPDIPVEPTEPVLPPSEYETLKECLYSVLVTGSTDTIDISRFKYIYTEFSPVYYDLISNDAKLAYNCMQGVAFKTTQANGYMETFTLYNVSPTFSQDYPKMLASINDIKNAMQPSMSDMEKILWTHDYIVDKTVYLNNAALSISPAGPLAAGYGNCSGFAKALRLALEEIGLEVYYVSSPESLGMMNHAWIMVKLDGEWYHIDPTWNTTRSNPKGSTGHNFFLRTDKEFKTDSVNPHWIWKSDSNTPVSTDTKYSDWFGHSVTTRMYYYDGYWYYTYGQAIVRSKIDGSDRQVLMSSGGKTARITSFDKGSFTYSLS